MGAETNVSLGAEKGAGAAIAPSIWGPNASNQPAIPRSAPAAAAGRRGSAAERIESPVGASVRSEQAARMVGAKGGEAGTWVIPLLCFFSFLHLESLVIIDMIDALT